MSPSFAHRLRRQFLVLAAGLAITVAVFLLTPREPGMARLSLGTAYAGLILLGASLTIGPLNVIRGRGSPPSSNLRRDIGIFAGIFALVHMALGLQVHLGGDMLSYFLRRHGDGVSLRLDAFGIANHLGLAATLVLLLLLMLSNNLSLRWLKARRWKALQRSNYAVALLVLIHGALYQVLERRRWSFVLLFLAVAAVVAAVQFTGFRRRRQGEKPV